MTRRRIARRRHRILKLARTIADLARKYCSRRDCLY
ncbi:hypothetical protein [Nostoc sp. LPT]